MVYKDVGGGGYTPEGHMLLCLQDVGTVVEGIYKGFKDVPGFEGEGIEQCHTFEQSDSSTFTVIGFGLMNHILKKVKKGSQTKVTYKGKVGKHHKCTVAVDDDQETPF